MTFPPVAPAGFRVAPCRQSLLSSQVRTGGRGFSWTEAALTRSGQRGRKRTAAAARSTA
ncbi:hypothetical protein SSAG_05595 [Streptomyces sp. Mg1]|nr:hypothetical protein SSAG_05595 [Streptomyces sp. Mg1]